MSAKSSSSPALLVTLASAAAAGVIYAAADFFPAVSGVIVHAGAGVTDALRLPPALSFWAGVVALALPTGGAAAVLVWGLALRWTAQAKQDLAAAVNRTAAPGEAEATDREALRKLYKSKKKSNLWNLQK